MNGHALTDEQEAMLDYLTPHLLAGYCPTFREIREALGLSNLARVGSLLNQLEDRGRITRRRFGRRAIFLPERTALDLMQERHRAALAVAREGLVTDPAGALRKIISTLEPHHA